MSVIEIIDELLKKSKDYGFDESEVMLMEGRDFETTVYKNEVDKYSISENFGISFRGLKNGLMGYAYTEKVDESSIEMLLENAMSNLKNIDSKDKEFLFGNKDKLEYKEINQYNESLNEITNVDKINILKEMEELAYSRDKRVKTVNHCLFGDGESKLIIKNTLGLDLNEKSNLGFCYFSVGVEDNDEIQSFYSIFVGNDLKKFDKEKIAYEAVDKALALLGGSSVKSDNYPVIIENIAFSSLLKSFSVIFNADRVQKNMSLLKGKLNEKIGVDNLNIIDNPHLEGKVASRSFDSEGVPTKKKSVVKNGVLKTYLHNMKTANKDGVELTGNAVRGSYKSSVQIAPSNFYIEKGNVELEEMVKNIENGIYIVEFQGLHAGLNSISGDFSLAAKGFLIENGKKVRPVNQITVSGNFFKLLNNIEVIGKDLKFGFPSGLSLIGSPSIQVKHLTVSGN